MKKTVVWLVKVLSLFIILTVACSPYEFKNPTGARVTVIEEQKSAQPSDGRTTAPSTVPATSPSEWTQPRR